MEGETVEVYAAFMGEGEYAHVFICYAHCNVGEGGNMLYMSWYNMLLIPDS